MRMQSVRDVLRQRCMLMSARAAIFDAIRAGCAEAKILTARKDGQPHDAIRAGCAEAKVLHGHG